MITVYGRANSPNVAVVMWTLAELGLEAERLDCGHRFGGTDTPEFRAMNPTGLIPVLRDEHVTMFESGAILRYLASRYGRFPFWPEDPVARAPIDMWAEWGKVTLAADFVPPIFRKLVFVPKAERNQAEIDAAIRVVDRDLDILEARLAAHPYVTGSDFTLADIVIGTLLFRYFTVEIPRPERPAVSAYYGRLQERPAYQEHVMVPWESLRVAGA
jgi:glutathione S-transferase